MDALTKSRRDGRGARQHVRCVHVRERRALAHLYRLRDDAAQLGLAVDAIPGDPRAVPDNQVLRLPFEGVPVRVDQGYEGSFSHHDAANRYALDFANPRLKVPDLPHATPFLTSGCELPVLPPGGLPLDTAAQPTAPARPAWEALRKSELMKGWL